MCHDCALLIDCFLQFTEIHTYVHLVGFFELAVIIKKYFVL